MYRFNAIIVGVCLLMLLQSCGTTAPRLSAQDVELRWQQRQQQLSVLPNWRLRGRIGFISERESGSGSLYWEQKGEQYQLRVVAPLGRGSINISGDAAGVQFETDKGEQQYAGDVEQLIWERTGWMIPVQRLRYWVLGLPSDIKDEQYQLDEAGRLASVRSDQWQVQYLRYRNVENLELPAKIIVQGPDLKIKVAVSEWYINTK